MIAAAIEHHNSAVGGVYWGILTFYLLMFVLFLRLSYSWAPPEPQPLASLRRRRAKARR